MFRDGIKRIPPLIGATIGGAAGAALGAEGGIVGAALGGAIGYALQEAGEYLAGLDPATRAKQPPRVVGSIPTNTTNFVGRRQVLDDLVGFRKAAGSGVTILHGLGGCGKSATLMKFLEAENLLSTKRNKRSPDALFAWSFYQNNNIEQFLDQLIEYLEPLIGAAAGPAGARNPLLLPDALKLSQKRLLLVLDGLERIQEERQTQYAQQGAILNPALRALLQRAAENDCGNTRIIITSRLQVPELVEKSSKSVLVYDLNRLEAQDAIELLRKYGVRGSDRELGDAAGEYNSHAYSVALLGGALASEFRGDVRSRDRIQEVSADTAVPIARILRWYQDRLAPDQLLAMQVASVFRNGASVSDIAALIPIIASTDAPFAKGVSSAATYHLVKGLGKLCLVFVTDVGRSDQAVCDLHPLVRDFFYRLVVNPKALHAKALELPWAQDLLAARPGYRPTESEEIQRLIELIYHAMQSGRSDEAYRIYQDRLGGYLHLGFTRGDHPAGSKAVHALMEPETNAQTSSLGTERLARLYIDGALYLKNEGRLDDAIDLINVGQKRIETLRGSSEEYVSFILNRSGIELLRGRIGESIASAHLAQMEYEALSVALSAPQNARLAKECLTRLGAGYAVRAMQETDAIYIKALTIADSPEARPREYAEIRYGWYLALRGENAKAKEVLMPGRRFADSVKAGMIVHRMDAVLALAELQLGNVAEAESLVSAIARWATRADLHVFVISWLSQAILNLHKKDYERAIAVASEGLRHSGDNGFALEWIDLHVALAQAQAGLGRWEKVAAHCKLALEGDRSSHVFVMPGAADQNVQYTWAEAPARLLSAEAMKRDATCKPSDASKEREIASQLFARTNPARMDEIIRHLHLT